MPPIPDWDALHPLVIHFPIALFIVAPLFLLVGVVLPRYGRGANLAALVLLALGTIGAFVAVETGEAAAELADRTPEVAAVLDRHAELAETVRNVFAGLTLLAAGLVVVPFALGARWRSVHTRLANAVLVTLLLAANGLLVEATHQGGRLVHQLGVHALMVGG